jgi:aminoglycoside phosphotransferase (APT) family kinase protein
MAGMYLGTLDHHDPLYEVLALRAYPKTRYPVFHVHRMSGHHLVYRYSEQTTKSSVVGKFFRVNGANEHTLERIKGEYRNLVRLRELGLAAPPYSVVKPLCREEKIGLAVAEEFVEGKDLDYFLRRAVYNGATRALKHALWRLASFLHTMHERSAGASIARHEDVGAYFQRIVGKLQRQGVIDRGQGTWFLEQRDRWLSAPFMMAEEVIVHGDATPTNFIFRGWDDVVAIDLERMRRSDRVFDVGMVCGELKHAFLWRAGDRYASEPFITGFLNGYAQHFRRPDEAFREITRRVPFYMALTELRIARNNWLQWDYRKRLTWEAGECLWWGWGTVDGAASVRTAPAV